MMDINATMHEAYRIADDHGWHEEDRSFGDLISLCHAELSEAIEHFRNGMKVDEIVYDYEHLNENGDAKPDGIPIELADVVIRIMDMCGFYDINLGKAIFEKMGYNAGRPYRHGAKRI